MNRVAKAPLIDVVRVVLGTIVLQGGNRVLRLLYFY